jgi:hypothetical protein
MRRALFVVALLGLAAFGLSRCWESSRQEAKRPHDAATAQEEAVVSPAEPRPVAVVASPGPDNDAGQVPLNDESLMQQIRINVQSNPKLAETLIREEYRRFPNSRNADERDALLVSTLMNQHRFYRARYEAIHYFKHHPHGRYAEHIARIMGTGDRPQSRTGH